MGVVDEPIHDRIAEGGIADAPVPVLDGYLAREQRGATSRAVLNHLQEITAFAITDRGQAPVVEDEQISLAKLGEHFAVGAIAARDREFRQESRQAQVPHEVAVAARTMTKGTG